MSDFSRPAAAVAGAMHAIPPSARTVSGSGAETAKRYLLGTHRSHAPEETLARLRPLLPSMGITRIANVTGLDRTGIPVVTACRPNARSVSVSQGKGLSLDAARASAVMEAVEGWHGEHIVKPLKLASLAEMRREHAVVDVTQLPMAAGSRFFARARPALDRGDRLAGQQRDLAPLRARQHQLHTATAARERMFSGQYERPRFRKSSRGSDRPRPVRGGRARRNDALETANRARTQPASARSRDHRRRRRAVSAGAIRRCESCGAASGRPRPTSALRASSAS